MNDSNVPPNVISIIMDDLCWGDLGCHGNPIVRTPNLDGLRGESASMLRYCSGPLCSPARASFITGRYHPRTRVIDTYCGRSMIDPDEPTIARSLKTAGYVTGAFGKWHLGDCYPMRAMDMGFDCTLQHRAGGIGQPGDHPDNHARWLTDSYFDPVLYRNGVPEKTRGYCTDIFFDETIRFIEENERRPFFAYLATNAPHTPLIVGDEWADPYRKLGVNETHARLYGMVENIDMNVGRLLATLERLGLSENTLVLYTSDHGPCASARDAGAPEGRRDRYNAGLRGIKGEMYEGGIRVPCFWRWPGRIERGVGIDRVSHPIDVLPTVLAACGVALPTGHTIDGKNILPLLSGAISAEAWPEREIFMQWHRGNVPVRYRNYAVITQRYKLHRSHEDRPDELYDLAADPFEKNDIAGACPEIVSRMRGEYENWLRDVAGTRGIGTFDPPRIRIGAPEENPTLLTTNDWRLLVGEDWCRDDLRGYWETAILAEDEYDVTIRFRTGLPSGRTFLRIEDVIVSCVTEQGADTTVFGRVRLPKGPARVEAWRELDRPCAGALNEKFVAALYVEIGR